MTGFGKIGKELISRFHDSGKYDICEIGCYGHPKDPRAAMIPWEYYPATPTDPKLLERYNSSIYGQFGETVFDYVCEKFRPDICLVWRDFWMDSFIDKSPYRKYFKWIWCPTVDGEPQKIEWLDEYSRVDKLLTYSRYGKDLLEEQSYGKIRPVGILAPGVNHEIFKPLDVSKEDLRNSLGLKSDIFVVTSVMRNQKRKLFPDLIRGFTKFLEICGERDPELANKTFLYLHTSYPDVGYDISRHILENNLGHKIITTYKCRHQSCGKWFVDYFNGEIQSCKHCGLFSAGMTNTQDGISDQDLCVIYNISDIYVQYSIAEGFGCPIAEAKSCGIPALAVDYSAMSEQVECDGCAKIPVQRSFDEAVIETEQERALPDNDAFAQILYDTIQSNKGKEKAIATIVRKNVVDNHSFERSYNLLKNIVDSMDIHDRKETWDSGGLILKVPQRVPEIRENSQFVNWVFENFFPHRPDWHNSVWKNNFVKGLNCGYIDGRNGKQKFDRNELLKIATTMVNNHNHFMRMLSKDKTPEILREMI